jgi:hypothetical protein
VHGIIVAAGALPVPLACAGTPVMSHVFTPPASASVPIAGADGATFPVQHLLASAATTSSTQRRWASPAASRRSSS